MSMQDPIADMLTRIRNEQAVGGKQISMPFSHLKGAILQVLKDEGYIENFELITADNKTSVRVALKYYQDRPVIENIKRISRPGLRVYKRCEELPVIRGGMGIAIISTPKGVMADKKARSQNVGGEVLCIVE